LKRRPKFGRRFLHGWTVLRAAVFGTTPTVLKREWGELRELGESLLVANAYPTNEERFAQLQ